MPKSQQASLLLEHIEKEMIALGLWDSNPPAPGALASKQPFCCDTLTFGQWLQFVLLPRMNQLLDSGQGLPANFAIHPMGEEAFKFVPADTRQLLALLLQLDRLSIHHE